MSKGFRERFCCVRSLVACEKPLVNISLHLGQVNTVNTVRNPERHICDFYTKVLTLKEPSAQSFPLIFLKLLKVQANFFITTEWQKKDEQTRARIHSRRRHFHNTKRSFVSYLNTSDAPAAAEDILVDDSKEAQIQNLGTLKEMEVNGPLLRRLFVDGGGL